MEFHINFGIPGVIIGFLLLGFAIGKLDRKAAEADEKGELGEIYLFFLPAIALIQPQGSMVELMSGAAASVAASLAWRWGWERWPKPPLRQAPKPVSLAMHPRGPIVMIRQPRQIS